MQEREPKRFTKGSVDQKSATAERQCAGVVGLIPRDKWQRLRDRVKTTGQDSSRSALQTEKTVTDREQASRGGLEAERAKMSNLSALQQLFNICRVPIRGPQRRGLWRRQEEECLKLPDENVSGMESRRETGRHKRGRERRRFRRGRKWYCEWMRGERKRERGKHCSESRKGGERRLKMWERWERISLQSSKLN